ncbi:MAG: PAS domain S-box protein [Candidatus Nitrospinota bacterium M3_3B_026]
MSDAEYPAKERFTSDITRGYVLALGLIASLVLSAYWAHHRYVQALEAGSSLINISGRQRMLSQRVALFSLRLSGADTAEERENARMKLLEALALMEESHRGLIEKAVSPAARAILFEDPVRLDERVKVFLAEAGALADEPPSGPGAADPRLARILAAAEGPLVDGLDAFVGAFEQSSEEATAFMDKLQLGAAALILIVLGVEGVFIFKPMARRVGERTARLLKNEKELRLITSTMGEGLYVTDSAGLITFVNPEAERLLGFEKGELLGERAAGVEREYCNGVFDPEEAAGNGGAAGCRSEDAVFFRKDGEAFPASCVCTPIEEKSGIKGFVTVFRDITARRMAEEELRKARDELEDRVKEATAELMAANEHLRLEVADRKRAEEALRESEEKYRVLIERANDGIVIIQDGVIKYMNPSAFEMIGYGPEEALGADFTKLVHPEHLPIAVERYRRRMAGEDVPAVYETKLLHKNGDMVDVEVNAGLVDYEGGPADMVFLRDIAERKRAEMEVRSAHAETEQLLGAVPSILIGVDDNQRVTRWNKAAETVFGIGAEDAIGKKFFELGIKWDWDAVSKQLSGCLAGGGMCRIDDIPYIRPDGKNGFLGFTFTPIYTDSGNFGAFLALGADITDRKILEGQLAQAQKLESIGQLAAGIAHEINTPTQYVGDNIRFFHDVYEDFVKLLEAYGELLEAAKNGRVTEDIAEKVEKTAEEIDIEYLLEEIPKAIEQSLAGVERVAKIVRAMKEFSHPGAEEKAAMDLNKAIESTITVARNEWKYVAEMETDFDQSLPSVPILPGEFNQVILNLIINAAHAIADVVGDGGGGKGKIKISTRKKEGYAEIRISDTGGGIPDDITHRIFDPFFTTKDVGKGTGQGLAIARSAIVDKHNGKITFDTEPGRGTTFMVRLPLGDEASSAREGM